MARSAPLVESEIPAAPMDWEMAMREPEVMGPDMDIIDAAIDPLTIPPVPKPST